MNENGGVCLKCCGAGALHVVLAAKAGPEDRYERKVHSRRQAASGVAPWPRHAFAGLQRQKTPLPARTGSGLILQYLDGGAAAPEDTPSGGAERGPCLTDAAPEAAPDRAAREKAATPKPERVPRRSWRQSAPVVPCPSPQLVGRIGVAADALPPLGAASIA